MGATANCKMDNQLQNITEKGGIRAHIVSGLTRNILTVITKFNMLRKNKYEKQVVKHSLRI